MVSWGWFLIQLVILEVIVPGSVETSWLSPKLRAASF